MTKLTPETLQCGTCSSSGSNNLFLSVTVHDTDSQCTQTLAHVSPLCPYRYGSTRALDFVDDDGEGVDELLGNVFAGCSGFGGKVYSVVVVSRDGVEEVRAVVGKHRHAWIVGSGLEEIEEERTARVAEIFVKVFVNGGKEEGFIHGEFMPVGADGRIVLSFNLLNRIRVIGFLIGIFRD